MNTQGFLYQNTIEANYLTVTFPTEAKYDEIALKALGHETPDFLVPFIMTSSDGINTCRYKPGNAIALEYAAENSFRKEEFLYLFENLISPLTACRNWLLDYHFLCFDPHYVYIDKGSNLVRYVYVPEVSYSATDNEILDFLKNIFSKANIVDDATFQVKMYKFFAGTDVTLSGLSELIKKELPSQKGSDYNFVDKEVASQHFKSSETPEYVATPQNEISSVQPVGQVQFATPVSIAQPAFPQQEKGQVLQPQSSAPAQYGNDDVLSLLNGSQRDKKKDKKEKKQKNVDRPEKKGLFSKKNKNTGNIVDDHANNEACRQSGIVQNSPLGANSQNQVSQQGFAIEPTGAYVVQTGGPANDYTETFDDESRITERGLVLISSPIAGAIPRISFDFSGDHVTIGRTSSDPVQPEVAFDSNFRRIGRRHARIEKRPDGFYIIDLGSQNRTLVNDTPIFPNQPVKLQAGFTVTFTDSLPVKYRVIL